MSVKALVDYYEVLLEQDKVALPGWCDERVSFALNISLSGQLLQVIPTVNIEQRGKKSVAVPQVMTVPERVIRTGNVVSNFLCDHAGFFLGLHQKGDSGKTKEYFDACRKLHLDILKTADSPAAKAVKAFFMSWDITQAGSNKKIEPYLNNIKGNFNFVFMVDGGEYAHEDVQVKNAWNTYKNQDEGAAKMRCLVTGKKEPIAVLHGKIKGVQGAQTSGANLISFNKPSFESYGRENAQGLNASVGKYAAFAYVTAINRLISDNEHKRKIGDTTVVYWAQNADSLPQRAFSMCAFPRADEGELLAGIMNHLAKGEPIDNVDMKNEFYILGLAPNAARISVRFFYKNAFGNMLVNLRRHYQRLEIIKPDYDKREYLSIQDLLAETINPNSKDKSASPLLTGAVFNSIINGTAYPRALYQAVLRRVKAEQDDADHYIYKITRGRVAVIKACLLMQAKEEERQVLTVALNEETKNRPYILGRLFAVLEDIQQQANPNVKTTIKNKYFTSACTTPGVVFPQILKLSLYHSAKLEDWVKEEKEREKMELLDKLNIENKPLHYHHTLNEQGLFILGYYQQVQAKFKKMEGK